MPSDIVLNDDDSVAITATDLQIAHSSGDYIGGVVTVQGQLQFRHRILVEAPTPPPAFPAPPPGPVDGSAKLAGIGMPHVVSGSFDELTVIHEVHSNALARLRKMRPPYDVFQMLDLMRQAILDLQHGGP